MIVQRQMSFLEVPLTATVEAAVWQTLDQAQRDGIVETLARLIVKTLKQTDLAEEAHDE